MRYGAQRRMKIGGCANWRPKDTRLPWRPQLEREDFRGSLGAADTSGKRFLTETSLAQLTTAQQLVSWLVESVRATPGLLKVRIVSRAGGRVKRFRTSDTI